MVPDFAKTVKDALLQAEFAATLHVDDDFQPTPGSPVLLVADDGGPSVTQGPWTAIKGPRRPILRLTAFANGRTEARDTVVAAAEFVRINKPGIGRIEDISSPLITRDRETGAFLASITMPVIVRQTA